MKVGRIKKPARRSLKRKWHRVTAVGTLAPIIERFVSKGSRILVEGQIVYRKWQDKSGETKYSTEIKAKNIKLLDSKGETSDNNNPEEKSSDDEWDF